VTEPNIGLWRKAEFLDQVIDKAALFFKWWHLATALTALCGH
jgi:hypothetical protein